MKQQVIVDTGVLVAIINKNDHYHDWAIQQFAYIQPPLLTCEAIISEACFLLGRYQQTDFFIAMVGKRDPVIALLPTK